MREGGQKLTMTVTNCINVRDLQGKRVPRYGRVDELFTRENGDKRLEKGMS